MTARLLPPSPDAISEAVRTLATGGLVVLPTETVYGLGAHAGNPDAVARIFAVKGRPSFNPLIAHVSSIEQAETIAHLTDGARTLAAHFWPGPLTLVCSLKSETSVCRLARAGLDSVALRLPGHEVAQEIIRRLRHPIVAPSANPSGRISPTRAEHVLTDLGDQVDLIIDGGACHAGVESTVIDARGDVPRLLRPGPIAVTELDAAWPGLQLDQDETSAPRSPGQLLRHYAPRARLRLNATRAETGEVLLGFGPGHSAPNLSPTGNLQEAAHRLFHLLRQLDQRHDRIAVAPIPTGGLGDALNDRLTRAAKRD